MGETNEIEEIIVMRIKGIHGKIYRQRPLIRCKDCKLHGSMDCPMFTEDIEFVTDDDWFCADGEPGK